MLSAFPEKMKFKFSKLLVGIPIGKATGIKKTSKIPIEVPVSVYQSEKPPTLSIELIQNKNE